VCSFALTEDISDFETHCDQEFIKCNAAFTPHAGLTNRYRTKSLYKSTFVFSKSRDISFTFMKRIYKKST